MGPNSMALYEGPVPKVLGRGILACQNWKSGINLLNQGEIGLSPRPVVGMAALMTSGSPLVSFFPFLEE